MGSSVEKIHQVINSSLLLKELCFIPSRGATEEEIQKEEGNIGHCFATGHKELLMVWNGIILDIITFFGCGVTEGSIRTLSDNQFDFDKQKLLIIGSDPAGFLYGYSNSEIFSIDSKGKEIKHIASDWEDFICNYLFGKRGEEFGGYSWLKELDEAGILKGNF